MDCWTSVERPEDCRHDTNLIEMADAIVLAAESAASEIAWREALTTVLLSSSMARNSCLDSCGSESANFAMDCHTLKSYLLCGAWWFATRNWRLAVE